MRETPYHARPRLWALALVCALTAACGLAPERVASQAAHAAADTSPTPITYIHEFPHPRVVVHYHPRAGQEFRLSDVVYALEQGCHGLELDLHMRGAEVVCNHDGPTVAAPRLADVLALIARYQGASPTVHRDGRQFFLVLEPKDNDPALFAGIEAILARYTDRLSTASGPDGGARGITVVMTGGNLGPFADTFRGREDVMDRLCLLEGRDYSKRIVNRAKDVTVFQWVALRYPDQRERLPLLHAGTDPRVKGRYNVRVWGAGDHLVELLDQGVDSINCDHEQVPGFTALVRARERQRGSKR